MIQRTFLVVALAFFAFSCDTLSNLITSVYAEPTEAEIGSGLKEALEIGIGKGSDALSQIDGYFKSPYKILLPEEARKITNKLKNVPGFSDLENVILEKINRGAEDAAKQAKPIFVDAIRAMTFSDALSILTGGSQDAATQFLQRGTNEQLYTAFNPTINASLDKFDARKIWSDAVKVYNKIPLVEKANPDLGDYVTREALKGLFAMVAKEEQNIRTNVSARTSELLRKVFAKQDKK
ncbi:DUF4197 domain-containing protein [Haliscomenobacter hydrossis]|uniref:DUF4197 domain-containing protein n=1 Tax=Haliscomenobacter hydrossis (strain ATCC 27775 / DSM 1100 / LMG 10767 / O) TaxID=760192 RepID=F4L566_HALH1|nr:DUF4197 domain-containing protein [Haliscomenobacter hydrossis]AEE49746.1 hypothetical protein Halhy_1861 [Haliscomenobacter hydrossis DSM 1100]